MEKNNIEFQQLIEIIYRHRVLIILSITLSLILGLELYIWAPKKYKATAIILFERQKINPTIMSPDVQTKTKLFIANVSQQITSREKLEEIIKKYDLFKDELKRHPIEDVVMLMRDNFISIKAKKGDTFEVSFIGSDPKKVMLVTNDLASKFIEENLRFREQKATETAKYIENELKMAKKAIDEKEAAMRDYKLKYYNEMPDKLESNMRRLSALQDQYTKLQEIIQDLEKTRVMVQEQMTQALYTESGESSEQEIISKLAKLRSKYTEMHPEIRRLKRLLHERRTALASSNATNLSDTTMINSIKRQLNKIDTQLARLRLEKENIKNEIEKYAKWINNTPIREAEWSALTRDYAQLKDHYDRLVQRKIQAESAVNLERQQKGTQLKIIEYAHTPDKPFKPNFKVIMIMALVVGLTIGFGLTFLIEFLDNTFKKPEEIENYLGIPVICAIPFVMTKKSKWRKRIKSILDTSIVLISISILIFLSVYHWRKGDIF